MKPIRIAAAIAMSTFAASAFDAAHAAECARAPSTDRPKIGLVLGGGGARGAAHIGVIQLLQELHVPVDYIAGTSMGSLVGAFYATGMNAEQLDATVRAIDFDTLFKDSTARKDEPYLRKLDDNLGLFGPKLGIGKDSQLLGLGAISGQKISFLFESLTSSRVAEGSFDNLPIPYRAMATDIITGDGVVIDKGNIAVAMRASMSVPGAFDPVIMGDYMLVDGGLANNVPIDVVRKMGADIVIAVDVGTPLEPRENLTSLVSITAQLSGLLVVRNAQAQIRTLTDRDILITPAARLRHHLVEFRRRRQGDSDRIRRREPQARRTRTAVDRSGAVRAGAFVHRSVRHNAAAGAVREDRQPFALRRLGDSQTPARAAGRAAGYEGTR